MKFGALVAMLVFCFDAGVVDAQAESLSRTVCEPDFVAPPVRPPIRRPASLYEEDLAPTVRLYARGLEIVRARVEGNINAAAPSRDIRIEVVRSEFPDFDLARGSIQVLLPGESTSGDQGGVRQEERSLRAGRPPALPTPAPGSLDRVHSAFRWPRRHIRWNGGPRWGFFPDVARITLMAPPTDHGWIRRLRSEGIINASDTLDDLFVRHMHERARASEKPWLDTVHQVIMSNHETSLRTALAASNADASLGDRIFSLRVALISAVGPLYTSSSHPWLDSQLIRLRRSIQRAISMPGDTDDKLAKLREAAESLLDVRASLGRSDRLTQHADWASFRQRACPRAQPGPVASFDLVEDELFPSLDERHPRVIEFDYDLGYVARSDDAFYVSEGDHLFVRVHGVPADQPVSILWNETVVTTTRAERGLDGMPAPPTGADGGAGDQRNVVIAPRSTAEPRSALLLRVGQVRSGRYAFSVCRSGTNTTDCQRSGHHSLTVQGERWWGFRAGLGLDLRWARNAQYQAERIGISDVYRITRSDDLSLRGAVPFSMVFYLPPYRQLHRNQFEWGLATGLDLLRPTRRFHAGLHLGGGPIGVLIAATLTRRNVPNVGSTTILESEVAPNLRTIFGSNRTFAPGVMLALTFDFDVFKRIFEAIIFKGFPGIGGGESGSQ